MVKTLKDKDIPEPWFAKKSKHVTITRAASKQMAQHQVIEDDLLGEPSAKGETSEKGKGKEDVAGRGRKKAKTVRPATAEVVMGRSKYVVPDPEEIRRKMIADAEACGRVVKSLSQTTTRKSCPTPELVEQSVDRVQPEFVPGDHSGSPGPEMPAAEEGMDIQAQECGTEVIVNEERETVNAECARPVQERGKRKAIGSAVRISTSPERSDPAQSAQKYRRLNRSPSPIILKERVRW